ncbi:MAG TPA: class I SAM-dependent methyltransferase [Burkholderiales bacterium]|jgi:2-polyprenyl-6-hydroxyphenyl methylase/3-demethylubiquinone-9 3-methyltransferase|nr:class I SAM-dependent methyltransferase [Burkholderiales bacterium]
MFAQTIQCKICGFDAEMFGAVDFSQNCPRVPLPATGVQVPYYRCANCKFLFTNLCDNWTQDEFGEKIYNDDYAIVDPDFSSKRPLELAEHFARLMQARKGALRLLDYGGGTGVFAQDMCARGFEAVSYDPFHDSDLAPSGEERFELLHCSEVIEHSPDPRAFVADMVRRMAEESAVYLSTALQPPDIEQIRLGWWYVGPRNGHISLFSQESLSMLWTEHGFNFGCYDLFTHVAWRGQPPCLPALVGA